jgi:bacterioferritin-associated ferredoxin
MYVCLCKCVRDRDLRQAAEAGVRSFDELQQVTGVSTGCGRCEDMARDVFERALDPAPLCGQPA